MTSLQAYLKEQVKNMGPEARRHALREVKLYMAQSHTGLAKRRYVKDAAIYAVRLLERER